MAIKASELFGAAVSDQNLTGIYRFSGSPSGDTNGLLPKTSNFLYKLQSVFGQRSERRVEGNRAARMFVEEAIQKCEDVDQKLFRGVGRLALQPLEYLKDGDRRVSGRTLQSITDQVNFVQSEIQNQLDAIPDEDVRQRTKDILMREDRLSDINRGSSKRFSESTQNERIKLASDIAFAVENAKNDAIVGLGIEAHMSTLKQDGDQALDRCGFTLCSPEIWETIRGAVEDAFNKNMADATSKLGSSQNAFVACDRDPNKFNEFLNKNFSDAFQQVEHQCKSDWAAGAQAYKTDPKNSLKFKTIEHYLNQRAAKDQILDLCPYTDLSAHKALAKLANISEVDAQTKYQELDEFEGRYPAILGRAGGFPDTFSTFEQLAGTARLAIQDADATTSFWKNTLRRIPSNLSQWVDFQTAAKSLEPYRKAFDIPTRSAALIGKPYASELGWAVGANKLTPEMVNEVSAWVDSTKASRGSNSKRVDLERFEKLAQQHQLSNLSAELASIRKDCAANMQVEDVMLPIKPHEQEFPESLQPSRVVTSKSASDAIDSHFADRKADLDWAVNQTRIHKDNTLSHSVIRDSAALFGKAIGEILPVLKEAAACQTSKEWTSVISKHADRFRAADKILSDQDHIKLFHSHSLENLHTHTLLFVGKYLRGVNQIDQLPLDSHGMERARRQEADAIKMAQKMDPLPPLNQLMQTVNDPKATWKTKTVAPKSLLDPSNFRPGPRTADLDCLDIAKTMISAGNNPKFSQNEKACAKALASMFSALGAAYRAHQAVRTATQGEDLMIAKTDLEAARSQLIQFCDDWKKKSVGGILDKSTVESLRSRVLTDSNHVLETLNSSIDNLEIAIGELPKQRPGLGQ